MTARKPFTVKELAEYLVATYPPDMLVVGDAYEGGFNDLCFKEEEVVNRGSKRYYDGKYENYDPRYHYGKFIPIKVVVIHTALRDDN